MAKCALLIGLNDYHLLGELKYARQDAEAFGDALRKHCGFSDCEMTIMTCSSEGGLQGLSRYIEKALTRLADCRDLDLLVFGFWGHGFSPESGHRYLCGIDTDEDDLKRSAVSLELVNAKLAQVQAENTLLVLDCCQNRPAGRSAIAEPMMKGEEEALAALARDIQTARRKQFRSAIPTVAVLNSCRDEQKAYEWVSRGHGIFTAYFLEAFEKTTGSVASMASWMADRVAKTALDLYGQMQVPYITIEGKGDFQLVLNSSSLPGSPGYAGGEMSFDVRTTIPSLGPQSILKDRYEIVEELGCGGIGVVYKAKDLESGTVVAIKVLPEELARDARALRNLAEEAKISMRLTYPYIMRLLSFEMDGQWKFLVMEYIKGETLAARLAREGKIIESDFIPLASQICEGLAYAHDQKVIHRDIKPSNVMVTEAGEVKILDFGISRVMKDSITRVARKQTPGMLIYMSPEQVRGKDEDHRSDIYSLGIMFYEISSGYPPFAHGDITYQHLNEKPSMILGISEQLNEIILKCLEKEMIKRFQSAVELNEALLNCRNYSSGSEIENIDSAFIKKSINNEFETDIEKNIVARLFNAEGQILAYKIERLKRSDYAMDWISIAKAMCRILNKDEALYAIKKAETLASQYDWWNEIAEVWDRLGKHVRAIEIIDRLKSEAEVRELPSPEDWISMAETCIKIDETERAFIYILKAFEIAEDYGDITPWLKLALIFKKLKNDERMLQCMKNAKGVLAKYDNCSNRLEVAETWRALGFKSNASRQLEQAQKLATSSEDWSSIAITSKRTGNLNRSVIAVQNAVEKAKRSRHWTKIAKAWMNLEDKKMAELAVRKANNAAENDHDVSSWKELIELWEDLGEEYIKEADHAELKWKELDKYIPEIYINNFKEREISNKASSISNHEKVGSSKKAWERLPISIGIETAGGVFTKILKKGSELPAQLCEIFSTFIDSQPSVELHLIAGENELASQNIDIGRFHLDGISPAQRGVPKIEIQFDISSSGQLIIGAKDVLTGKISKMSRDISSLFINNEC